mgnify:CR=1 FL=1|jgi:hypothetical protein
MHKLLKVGLTLTFEVAVSLFGVAGVDLDIKLIKLIVDLSTCVDKRLFLLHGVNLPIVWIVHSVYLLLEKLRNKLKYNKKHENKYKATKFY